VQNQFHLLHGPRGKYEGATIVKTFLHLLQWGKVFEKIGATIKESNFACAYMQSI
jgi:hypothetical protein